MFLVVLNFHQILCLENLEGHIFLEILITHQLWGSLEELVFPISPPPSGLPLTGICNIESTAVVDKLKLI